MYPNYVSTHTHTHAHTHTHTHTHMHAHTHTHTQAEAHPKVQELIQKHIPILLDYVLFILKRLKEIINEVPFGIRWLCKATRALVQEKFPEAEVDTINAFVGGFFFLRYINPVIVTPHGEHKGNEYRTSLLTTECLL